MRPIIALPRSRMPLRPRLATSINARRQQVVVIAARMFLCPIKLNLRPPHRPGPKGQQWLVVVKGELLPGSFSCSEVAKLAQRARAVEFDVWQPGMDSWARLCVQLRFVRLEDGRANGEGGVQTAFNYAPSTMLNSNINVGHQENSASPEPTARA